MAASAINRAAASFWEMESDMGSLCCNAPLIIKNNAGYGLANGVVYVTELKPRRLLLHRQLAPGMMAVNAPCFMILPEQGRLAVEVGKYQLPILSRYQCLAYIQAGVK